MEYLKHTPPDAGEAVVLAFHGGGASALMMRKFCGLDRVADRERFTVIYPDSEDGYWHCAGLDQVRQVEALLDELRVSRAFAAGFSNGAAFCHHLAANLSERIAAIACVAGGMADTTARNFHPTAPVPVLIIQGDADPIVPFAGGPVRGGRGRVIGTLEAVEKWRAAGSAVELITIRGGGHTWPGGPQYLSETLVGKTSREFDAAEKIWEFFRRVAQGGRTAADQVQ